MCYWEYELFIDELNNLVKKENDEQTAEMKKYNLDDYKKMTNPKHMQSNLDKMTPKMPSMNFSTPKLF